MHCKSHSSAQFVAIPRLFYARSPVPFQFFLTIPSPVIQIPFSHWRNSNLNSTFHMFMSRGPFQHKHNTQTGHDCKGNNTSIFCRSNKQNYTKIRNHHLNFCRWKRSFQRYPDPNARPNGAWDMHKKLSEKLGAKLYTWLLHGKIYLSRWCFLWSF